MATFKDSSISLYPDLASLNQDNQSKSLSWKSPMNSRLTTGFLNPAMKYTGHVAINTSFRNVPFGSYRNVLFPVS